MLILLWLLSFLCILKQILINSMKILNTIYSKPVVVLEVLSNVSSVVVVSVSLVVDQLFKIIILIKARIIPQKFIFWMNSSYKQISSLFLF